MSEAKETYTIGERSSPFLGITASISAAGILLYSLVNYSLWGSFWLDETISYWITNNSFHDVTQRAISHQGQSPLYFWILWAWRQAIGHNEFALRLPSLLFGLASLAVLWNLVRNHISREVAWLSLPLVVSSTPFIKVCINARPYSLALLFVLLTISCFLQFSRSKTNRPLYACAFFFVLTFYAHYLFAAVGSVLLFSLLWPHRALVKTHLRSLLVTAALLFIVMIPGFLHLLQLSGNESLHIHSPTPTLSALFSSLFLPRLLVAFLCAGLGSLLIFSSKVASLPKESRGTLSFCLIWWLLPPLLFFTLGQVGEGALFQPRYFMWSSLALCILLAQALSLIHSRKVKVVSVVVFALLLLLLPRQWQRENWRDAIAAVNAVNGTETVLLYSGLFEADSVAKNVSEKDFDYLLSPLSPYPLKKMAILLPSSFESKSHERYFTQEIQPLLEHGDVLLLSPSMKQHLSPHGTVPKYFLAYFEIRGYGAEEIFSQGLVQAYRLKRLTPSST